MASYDTTDQYQSKLRTAEAAIGLIRSGKRIFIGSACGEPIHLVNTLVNQAKRFSDLEIVRLMSSDRSPLSLIATESQEHNLNMRFIYQGSATSERLAANKRYIAPMNLYAVPRLFRERHLPLHAALIQVSPPDSFGWMSLGVSVDVTRAAALSADMVIAQVNPRMPRILGHSFIHMEDVDIVVEYEEDIYAIENIPDNESAVTIGRLMGNLIDDGSTIQMGLGNTPQGIMMALSEKNDLGIHSQFMINCMMDLVKKGVITNRKKGLNNGKLVASSAIGTKELYEFLHDNPAIEFYPSDYTNDPNIISQHNKMVAGNVARAIDLTGHVAAEVMPKNHYSGVTGLLDFVRGASSSPGGKSIIIIPATGNQGKTSRIVAELDCGSVVVPRSDVSYVVSEFGAVNLFGKNLQERAMAMISLAHPDFRDELLQKAKDQGLMREKRSLSEFVNGIYPAKMEETRTYGDERVTFRPAKPVDNRRIQEHFYNLTPEDVQSRFFIEKTCFLHDDMESMFQIDYVKDMTVVAVTGEFGFGKVIGMGVYLLEPSRNIAEIAFSVSKEWQNQGIASVITEKLLHAARENGIAGVVAYTSMTNKGMISLFKKIPYKVHTSVEEDMLVLMTRFDEPL
ncbi:MAG: GNAT family N-acetyltransferase [SAR324 cluster bacterium]|nr:GNAT family N-acetyltransferase [SAR324 cluster bacterium]